MVDEMGMCKRDARNKWTTIRGRQDKDDRIRWRGTYQVQTNLSVQIIETSICTIRSTSNGRSAERCEGDLQKCDYPIQGRVQIVKLINPPYLLDVDPMTQIEVSIVCTERLVCT